MVAKFARAPVTVEKFRQRVGTASLGLSFSGRF
jgi:hypothetical protein